MARQIVKIEKLAEAQEAADAAVPPPSEAELETAHLLASLKNAERLMASICQATAGGARGGWRADRANVLPHKRGFGVMEDDPPP